MTTETLADAMQVFFVDNTGLSASGHSLNDLQFSYYSSRSGLTPIWHYSLTDHMKAFFAANGGTGNTIYELESSYYRNLGAVGPSYDDVKYDFYIGHYLVFITDHGNGTGFANTAIAPVTDHDNGTGFIGLPATVTDHGDGTGYGFI